MTPEITSEIGVEVAYALPERQTLMAFKVPVGTSMLEAVRLSGIVEQFGELEQSRMVLGVFGQRVADPATRVLVEGDRVEIYRPLEIDPKAARRARARRARGE